MKFYIGRDFDDYVTELWSGIDSTINSQSDSYILNVNSDDYSKHLAQKFTIDTPILYLENVQVDAVEKDISGSRFPRFDFMFIDQNKLYRKEVIIYHIPYTGDISILELRPNPRELVIYESNIDDIRKFILVEIVNFYNDSKKITFQYNQELRNLTGNYSYLKKNCDYYNKGLNFKIKDRIEKRKTQLLQKNNLLASLGIPIKQKNNSSNTFSVPNPKLKDKIIIKPKVTDKLYEPEPTLDFENFRKILKIINDIGKNLERLPSTYKGKSEEDIRDHILIVLDPNFEYGSASGETFNKKGKTDILLSYDSTVVFVAECKYWKGEKGFLATIDQLLGYLTWRNSKVAIINFVQNSEFTDVLSKIKSSIKGHSNFLKELKDNDESWFNYKFHLNGDRNRELNIAIISFHLPK